MQWYSRPKLSHHYVYQGANVQRELRITLHLDGRDASIFLRSYVNCKESWDGHVIHIGKTNPGGLLQVLILTKIDIRGNISQGFILLHTCVKMEFSCQKLWCNLALRIGPVNAKWPCTIFSKYVILNDHHVWHVLHFWYGAFLRKPLKSPE